MYKVAFCCKYVDPLNDKIKEKQLNTRTTTAKWVRENPQQAQAKIFEIVQHNLLSIKHLINYVSSLPVTQHAVRISSDILPLYTHKECKHFYQDLTLKSIIETQLAQAGELARSKNIRISMHPGQWTVLASENPNIVNNSIEEFEYHAYMLACMGYGKKFQDAKCNVHVSGKQGITGMISAYSRLSQEARNVITIENDEITYGIEDCLELSDKIPVVLDVHHHYIKTGEYINVTDDRVKRVIDSWKGIRPVMHLSQSREDILLNHCKDTLPSMQNLLQLNYKKQKLRAHSDYMWNNAVNQWSYQFLQHFDIMIEAKAKNLASSKYVSEVVL